MRELTTKDVINIGVGSTDEFEQDRLRAQVLRVLLHGGAAETAEGVLPARLEVKRHLLLVHNSESLPLPFGSLGAGDLREGPFHLVHRLVIGKDSVPDTGVRVPDGPERVGLIPHIENAEGAVGRARTLVYEEVVTRDAGEVIRPAEAARQDREILPAFVRAARV